MDAFSKVLSEIRFSIPTEILDIAFGNNDRGHHRGFRTIDREILSKVLIPRVMSDLNLGSQETMDILLSKCEVSPYEESDNAYVITVPQSELDGREIITANSLYEKTVAIAYNPYQHSSVHDTTLMNSLIAMDNATKDIHISQSARITMLNRYTILVEDMVLTDREYVLKLIVSNDSDLKNISPKVYKTLSYLSVLAVKSYIYNHLNIKIDQGYIRAGHSLDSIKDTVSLYSDSEVEYREYYEETWLRVSYMQNRKNMYDTYKSAVSI